MAKISNKLSVETLKHDEGTRKNIPTAEYQSVMDKDEQDWSDLVVHAPPLYIQEKVHPKVIIDDLVASDQWLATSGKSGSDHKSQATNHFQTDLFADFNGIPEGVDKTEFYRHDNKTGFTG